jgi:hypothetical protein
MVAAFIDRTGLIIGAIGGWCGAGSQDEIVSGVGATLTDKALGSLVRASRAKASMAPQSVR